MMRRPLLLGAFAILLGVGCGPSEPPTRACATTADCLDDDACTVDERCDPATRTCASQPLDGDGDGMAPIICGGADCDDSISGARCAGDAGMSVDPQSFCVGFQVRVCARDHAVERITDAAYMQCRDEVESLCAGSTFPGCSPPEAAAQECFAALVDVSRLEIVATLAMPNLPECERVCE